MAGRGFAYSGWLNRCQQQQTSFVLYQCCGYGSGIRWFFLLQKKNNFQFCDIRGYKRGRTTNFFSPLSFVAIVPGSGINIPDPQHVLYNYHCCKRMRVGNLCECMSKLCKKMLSRVPRWHVHSFPRIRCSSSWGGGGKEISMTYTCQQQGKCIHLRKLVLLPGHGKILPPVRTQCPQNAGYP